MSVVTTGGRPLIVGVGGTVRAGSTTELALRAALAAVTEAGGETLCFDAQSLRLPYYAPGVVDESPAAAELVAALGRADGLIVASPGYHGGISGLVKNALDYAEELRASAPPYLDQKAVGCIVCANGPQAGVTTLAALRAVVHSLRGWPTPLGVVVNAAAQVFDQQGQIVDGETARRLGAVGRQVFEFADRRAPHVAV